MTKTCSKCAKTKDQKEFSRYERIKDGFRYECKSCQKLYRDNNVDKIREIKRLDHLKHRDERLRKMKEYRDKRYE